MSNKKCFPGLLASCGVALALMGMALSGCGNSSNAQMGNNFLTTKVDRREIVLETSSTGSIEPIRIIEIKSKASGQIINLPVETGDVVPAGALLAQVDTTDVSAQLRQSTADLEVARVREVISRRKFERATEMLQRGMISADEYDQARLDYATSRSSVIGAEADVQQKQERMAETVVRAPSAGTILTKKVERGQIIASAGQMTEGTLLMTMADLTHMQVRALVDETDVGKLRAGLPVTVQVDAYPGRKFAWSILKIEPESVEQQNITFFPMLVEIGNEEGLLRPGMNASVDVVIMRKEGVLALPNDAVRTPQSAPTIAMYLGVDPDTLASLIASHRSRRASSDALAGPEPRTPPDLAAGPQRPNRSPERQLRSPERSRGPFGGVEAVPPGIMPPGSMGIAFLPDSNGVRPVVVRTGIQNFEFTEIAEGLKAGDRVIVPPSLTIIMQSQEMKERMQRFSALPGRR